MAIKLIRKTERLSIEVDGTIFFYKRLPADQKERLIQKNSVRGAVNYENFLQAAFAWGVLDWSNLIGEDEEGNEAEVPFAKELVGLIPQEAVQEVGAAIVQGTVSEADPI